jgi:adenosylcobalamin-dependent ribonucleoside-triphosphate reductase
MDMSMKGGGVGMGVTPENVALFPKVSTKVTLHTVIDREHPTAREFEKPLSNKAPIDYIDPSEVTGLHAMMARDTAYAQALRDERNGGTLEGEGKWGFTVHHGDVTYVLVSDTREGWVDQALAFTIDEHFTQYGTKHLFLDYSLIRARNKKIKRFGGKASGAEPLARGMVQINNLLNNAVGRQLIDVEAGDITQICGTIVVAGNVRRTALILLGKSKEFIESKDYSKIGLVPSQWRWASNNSVVIDNETPDELADEIATRVVRNGEPGVFNEFNSKNFGRMIDGYQEGIDGDAEGTNPCGEVTLEDKEPCNLFEVNLVRCHELGIDPAVPLELATRYAYRVTFMPYPWDETRRIVQKNRRLGVSISGIVDYITMKFDGVIIGNEDFPRELDYWYDTVHNTNFKHAKALGTNPSKKKTTVKPSGSVSKVMGCSEGMHGHWAAHISQTIRVAADNPIMDGIYECGYPVEPFIQGRDGYGDPIYDYKSAVVSFPVKAPTADHPNFKSARDLTLDEQAHLQAMLQTYWSDNAVRATLSFHPVNKAEGRTEDIVIKEIADVLKKYKGVLKSTSFLVHDEGTYDQMPKTTITKEQYDEMVGKLKGRPWDFLKDGKVDGFYEELDGSAECAGGNCPVR